MTEEEQKMKKWIACMLALLFFVAAFGGCTSEGGESSVDSKSQSSPSEENSESTESSETEEAPSGEDLLVDFWSSPEQNNLTFWTNYAEKFNETETQLNGKTVQVQVQMMPAQPSSEAGLQNAIATDTIPAISENINRTVALIFSDADAIYDLSEEEWFQTATENRQIAEILEGWALDGHQYVMPLYVNPIGYAYNSKALRTLGITEVPTTLDDFYALLDAYRDSQGALDEQGITHFFFRDVLLQPTSYWERWFDVHSPYNALSGGTPMYDSEQLSVDQEALSTVYKMYGNMGSSLLTGTIENIWQQETVPVVMGMGLPWDVAGNLAAGKTYGLDGDYVFGPMFVKNEGDTAYNYGDTKGLVMYKGHGVTEEEHEAAGLFLDYVFNGGGKDSFDLDWLTTTTMLPVRGDLDTYTGLTEYFAENPAMAEISTMVKDAIPGPAVATEADMLTELGEKVITPMINEFSQLEIHTDPVVSSYVEQSITVLEEAADYE